MVCVLKLLTVADARSQSCPANVDSNVKGLGRLFVQQKQRLDTQLLLDYLRTDERSEDMLLIIVVLCVGVVVADFECESFTLFLI